MARRSILRKKTPRAARSAKAYSRQPVWGRKRVGEGKRGRLHYLQTRCEEVVGNWSAAECPSRKGEGGKNEEIW